MAAAACWLPTWLVRCHGAPSVRQPRPTCPGVRLVDIDRTVARGTGKTQTPVRTCRHICRCGVVQPVSNRRSKSLARAKGDTMTVTTLPSPVGRGSGLCPEPGPRPTRGASGAAPAGAAAGIPGGVVAHPVGPPRLGDTRPAGNDRRARSIEAEPRAARRRSRRRPGSTGRWHILPPPSRGAVRQPHVGRSLTTRSATRSALGQPGFGTAPVRLTSRGRVVVLMIVLALVLAAFSVGRATRAATATGGDSAATMVVQPGQSLWEIAGLVAPRADRRGTVATLLRLNPGVEGGVRPGKTLRVPRQVAG